MMAATCRLYIDENATTEPARSRVHQIIPTQFSFGAAWAGRENMSTRRARAVAAHAKARARSHEPARRASIAGDVTGDPGEHVGVDLGRLADTRPLARLRQSPGHARHDRRIPDRRK